MHLGVLRVLTKQTLEISSVVKDPTQLGPSLVTQMKDSSLTILHQSSLSYRWILLQLQVQREVGRNFRGFLAGGHTILRRRVRSSHRRKIMSKQTSGYYLCGLGCLFYPVLEEVTLSYYLLELSSGSERRTTHYRLRIQSFGGTVLHYSA
jgi:hypothetical protein